MCADVILHRGGVRIFGGVRNCCTASFEAHYRVFLQSMLPFLLSPKIVHAVGFHVVCFAAKLVACISTLGRETEVSG